MRAVSLISSDRSIISSRWAPKYVCQTSANFSPAACSESLHSLRSLTMRAPPVMDSVAGCDDAPRKRPGARLAGECLYGTDLHHVHRHAIDLPRQDLALAQSGSRNFPLPLDDEARLTGRLPAPLSRRPQIGRRTPPTPGASAPPPPSAQESSRAEVLASPGTTSPGGCLSCGWL